jgi:hypothetical protein
MKRFTFAMTLDIPADTYEDALEEARLIASILELGVSEVPGEEDARISLDYRMIYLPKLED